MYFFRTVMVLAARVARTSRALFYEQLIFTFSVEWLVGVVIALHVDCDRIAPSWSEFHERCICLVRIHVLSPR